MEQIKVFVVCISTGPLHLLLTQQTNERFARYGISCFCRKVLLLETEFVLEKKTLDNGSNAIPGLNGVLYKLLVSRWHLLI